MSVRESWDYEAALTVDGFKGWKLARNVFVASHVFYDSIFYDYGVSSIMQVNIRIKEDYAQVLAHLLVLSLRGFYFICRISSLNIWCR